MEHGHWKSSLTGTSPGAETSEATLFLFHEGQMVPVLQVTSQGGLFLRQAGVWEAVALRKEVPTSAILGEP